MDRIRRKTLPDDVARQWEVLLLLASDEEKKIDRIRDGEVETINYFYNNQIIREIFTGWMERMKATYDRKAHDLDTSTKCDDISLAWRLKGNQMYAEGDFLTSFNYYTKSAIYAIRGSPLYSLALANRSAAAVRLQMYTECLKDIKRALTNNYPMEQAYKLLLRKTDCLLELGKFKEANSALNECVNNFTENSPNREEFQADFDKKVHQRREKFKIPEYRDKVKNPFKMVKIENNKQFVNASTSVKLVQNDTFGRHVVTTKDTKRGDVLFLEEPYAWVTIQHEDYYNCDHCCDTNRSVIPCPDCSRATYCDESCAFMASLMYHRWECVGTRADIFKTIGIAHLALRVLLTSAHRGFPEYQQDSSRPITVQDLFDFYTADNTVDIFSEDYHPFLRMFNLVSNLEKMNTADYTQYALTANFLTIYLENNTNFFEILDKKINAKLSGDDLRIFAGALMFRAIGQLISNGHAVVDLGCAQDPYSGGLTRDGEIRRGTAIYPSAAMMNHSCEPNIISMFYKNQLVVKCARELPSGSEVYNCYGPHCARESRNDRREELRAQYHFHCECSACEDDTRKDFIALFSAYACQRCKGPVTWKGNRLRCHNCSNAFSEELARNILFTADEYECIAENTNAHQVRVEKMARSYKLKQQALYRHHVVLRRAADALAKLYVEYDEFSKAVDLIKQNIQSLEFQYGSFSNEVTHEIRKLSNVMLARVPFSTEAPEYDEYCRETFKITRKALNLMELNFGSWPQVVEDTKAKLKGLIDTMRNNGIADDEVENLARQLQESASIQ